MWLHSKRPNFIAQIASWAWYHDIHLCFGLATVLGVFINLLSTGTHGPLFKYILIFTVIEILLYQNTYFIFYINLLKHWPTWVFWKLNAVFVCQIKIRFPIIFSPKMSCTVKELISYLRLQLGPDMHHSILNWQRSGLLYLLLKHWPARTIIHISRAMHKNSVKKYSENGRLAKM